MKKLLITSCLLLSFVFCRAQVEKPRVGFKNTAPRRTELITYSTRNLAEKNDRESERYFYRLDSDKAKDADGNETYKLEVPLIWRDRDIFFHHAGPAPSIRVLVNGREVGTARDSRTPAEFFISPYVTDGENMIVVENIYDTYAPEEKVSDMPALPQDVFIYSQPSVRIHDVLVSAVPNETRKHGVLKIDVVISSSRNYDEAVTVGYDIYSPEKELKYYDLRDATAKAGKLDTVHFETFIYGAMERLWSAENPKLYNLTLYLKRNKIISEFLPVKVAFGRTTFDKEHIYRNEKPIEISAAVYNAAATEAQTEVDINRLKARKINTIYVNFPQPYWFYDLCDRIGMYVVDRANINTESFGGDRSRKGTLANNPSWLDEFLEREKNLYFRSRAHPCIIAWSLGGDSGNGYNMYRAYQWFKSVETERPVIYGNGEWNTDMALPEPVLK